jgi:hypothetical protein
MMSAPVTYAGWPASLPCLLRDMPAEVYHSIDAMSAGGLKRMAQSPAHFYGMQLDPNRPPAGEPTPALRGGTRFHCALFEPDELDARYIAAPVDAPRKPTDTQRAAAKPTQRTLDAMAWWDEFEGRARGKEIVTQAELQTSRTMAARVRALPDIASLMTRGYAESSAFWIDDSTGELCKCRPDFVAELHEGVILIDGKSAIDASPEGFGRAVWNFDYHLQAAWYSDGFERATGIPVLGFVFAAVESSWPHCAAAYMLGDDVLDKARREYRRLLSVYNQSKLAGYWPGYPEGVTLVNLPKWAQL